MKYQCLNRKTNVSTLCVVSILIFIMIRCFYSVIQFTIFAVPSDVEHHESLNPFDVNEEELSFPLAFSILVHNDFERFQTLLNSIYRTHNFYCIHIDKKSPISLHLTAANFTKQLGSNVYLIPYSEAILVKRGYFSVLEAELKCARTAIQQSKKWKYYINLSGHDFPLRTNWELVVALKSLGGANVIHGRRAWKRIWAVPPQYTYNNMSVSVE